MGFYAENLDSAAAVFFRHLAEILGRSRKLAAAGAIAVGLTVTGPVRANEPADVSHPGRALTPSGGEAAASKDGSIPAWEGEKAPLPGWTHDRPRGEFWAYKDEKPLFSIDQSNVDAYAGKLTPAQIERIRTTPGYRMDVYPTHRNCTLPDLVQQNTAAGAGKAKIGADGWSLEDAVLPGVPFPVPKNGVEAMWNFLTRYQGVGAEWPQARTVIWSPTTVERAGTRRPCRRPRPKNARTST